MFCTKCGQENEIGSSFCKKCGAAQVSGAAGSPQVLVVRTAKSPAIALILSFFFSGLGQIYNDEIKKGIWIIVAHAISIVLIFVLIGLVTTPIIWIWSMIDAYKTAERINRGALPVSAPQSI